MLASCLKIRSRFHGLKEDVSKVFSFCDVSCRVLTIERYKFFCDPVFITSELIIRAIEISSKPSVNSRESKLTISKLSFSGPTTFGVKRLWK